jgi:hypothetical protein
MITLYAHRRADGSVLSDFRATHPAYDLSAPDQAGYATAEAEALRIAGPDALAGDAVPTWVRAEMSAGWLREHQGVCQHLDLNPVQPVVIVTGPHRIEKRMRCAECAPTPPNGPLRGCHRCLVGYLLPVQLYTFVVNSIVVRAQLCEGCLHFPEEP